MDQQHADQLEPFQRLDEYLQQTTSEADRARAETYRAVVGEPRPTSRGSRFVCGGREAPIGQARWLLGGIARERDRVIAPVRRPRRRGAGRPGHRRTTSTRAGPSDDPPPGEPPPAAPRLAPAPPTRRRVIVDERYLVVRMAAA
jgi:hypothetical protein